MNPVGAIGANKNTLRIGIGQDPLSTSLVTQKIIAIIGVSTNLISLIDTGTTGIVTAPDTRAITGRSPGRIMVIDIRMVTESMCCRMVSFHFQSGVSLTTIPQGIITGTIVGITKWSNLRSGR